MLVHLFVILVAWSDNFFTGIPILDRFLAQPGSPGFSFFFSFFLSCPPFFLAFFLVHPYGLCGGILLSPVKPLDYVKKIGKFRMEIPPKNLTRLQG